MKVEYTRKGPTHRKPNPNKKPKVRYQGKVKLAKTPNIIYTIEDKYFEDFHVQKSANAWWIDRSKVERLIAAFKMDCIIEEAIVYAGISMAQWKYFVDVHPEFYAVKDACSQLPTLTARNEVVKGIVGDKEFALKYLERKRRKEFASRKEMLLGEDSENPFGGTVLDAMLKLKHIDTLNKMEKLDSQAKSKKH